MLKLYRRHLDTCKHATKGTKYTKCGCPIWVDGMHEGKRDRHSMDTFNWEEASRLLLEITADESAKDSSVNDAVDGFLEDCERRLHLHTFQKYRETLNALKKFCAGRAITSVRALDYATLYAFVGTLMDAPSTVGKKIERLRTFIRHCEDMGWCENNPARKIKKPKVTSAPVIPFTDEQQKAIIAAIDKYPTANTLGYDNRARVLAFILTLRYTALRISDVVKLRLDKINNNRLLLRTTKTGAPVHLPLPPALLAALKKIENGSPYYFWSGKGEAKGALNVWHRAFIKLLELAKVEGHPHMYRHTMAIDLLEKGVTVEQVAAILGNTPTIVYKHYAPWVESRQKALDAAVMSVWA
jgi:site-specific recombinase XerD